MEENIAAARTREDSIKSRASKRKRWLSCKWRVSFKGNPYIRTDGYLVTVYPRASGWAEAVASRTGSGVLHGRRNYPTQDDGKLAAFDRLTMLKIGNGQD
jgi:hypothetical protein